MNKESLSLQASMDDIDRLKPFIEHVASQAGIDRNETRRLRLAAGTPLPATSPRQKKRRPSRRKKLYRSPPTDLAGIIIP